MMRSTRRDEGFALAALICIISAAAVLTAVMVPLRVMQSRRETEQELIFRGQEYIRAIQKYQRKYGVYPSSIDDLVSRDGYRFIRRQYKDPVTGEDFRLINVNADGSLTGSLTLLSLPVSTQQNGAPGTMPAANGTSPLSGGGGGGGGNNTQGNTGRNGVQNSANTSGVGTISGAGGSMGMSSNSGISGISNPMSGGGTNTNNNSRAGVGGGGVGSGAGTGGAFGGGGATGGGGAPGTLAAGAGAFGPMTNPMNGGGNTQAQGNNTANRPGGTTGTGGGAPARWRAVRTFQQRRFRRRRRRRSRWRWRRGSTDLTWSRRCGFGEYKNGRHDLQRERKVQRMGVHFAPDPEPESGCE